VYQVTESPEDARELARVRVTCHTTLPNDCSLRWRSARGRKIPSDCPQTRARAEFAKPITIVAIKIPIARGKIKQLDVFARLIRRNKPPPRELSGIVKLRAVNCVISRLYVKKKERERQREREYRLSMASANADRRLAAEISARDSSAKFQSSKAANNAQQQIIDAIVAARLNARLSLISARVDRNRKPIPIDIERKDLSPQIQYSSRS